MGKLTPYDVKRWDLNAIQKVFETATERANTLQRLGENLQQVQNVLSDWQGEAGEAFRADLGKARRDIDADGQESMQVAAACRAPRETSARTSASSVTSNGLLTLMAGPPRRIGE